MHRAAISQVEHDDLGASRRIIGVVSADDGEGAPAVSLALSVALGRIDGPVLLIDCEGSLSEGWGVSTPGLRQVLEGTSRIDTCVSGRRQTT